MFLVVVGAWTENFAFTFVLTLFLLFCGICTAVILWQGRRVLGTILTGAPFRAENGVSLRRAAVCCFLIAAAALARVEELRAQGLPLKAAARQAAGEFGVPKNQLYDLALRNSPSP